jgi:hypothetical protein
LTINNEVVVFLMLKVVMARGRRLKKGGGDLEVQKQNVFPSELRIDVHKQSMWCGIDNDDSLQFKW